MNKPTGTRFKPSATALIMGWTVLATIGGMILIDSGAVVGMIVGSMALAPVPIWWIHRKNARNIHITGIVGRPYHAGDRGLVQVKVVNKNKYSIHEVNLSILRRMDKYLETTLVLPGGQPTVVNMTIPEGLLSRGRYKLDQATLHTGFPFHMFTTFHHADFDNHLVVYPEVEARAPDWPVSSHERRKSRMGDDIVGMRDYQHGDAMRSIDWKLSARRSSLVVREYDRPQHKSLLFSWDQVEEIGTERGLRRLTAWILRAEGSGHSYGLDLGDGLLGPGRGKEHLHACLEKLAVFRREEVRGP